MTARTDGGTMPAAPLTLRVLESRAATLRELVGVLDTAHGMLRDDAAFLPIPADAMRQVREAGDLLIVAARLIDPNGGRQ